MNSKIKVKRSVLVEAVELLAIRELQDYEDQIREWEKEMADWPKKAHAYVDKQKMPPNPPYKPGKPTTFQKVLDFLKMGTDEILTISLEDYNQFLLGRTCR